MFNSFLTLLIGFAAALVIAPPAIKFLHKLKFGQEIREIGPSWHKKKSGTPTMGGIIFIIALLIAAAVNFRTVNSKYMLVLISSLLFGAIGFIDDFIKVKRNLGLTSAQKFSMQLLVAVVFVLVGMHYGILPTKIFIPFAKVYAELGWLYIPFALFVVLGTVNSVNLTDGIDGLATSVTIIVMLFFSIALKDTPLTSFIYGLIGGLLGFLVFNKNPAKVFMGDTGSLFLGGAVAALAMVSENPLILILVGFIYFAETLSVIIQVTSFKLTGKRVFKMSPIHHHFELGGWKETKIVKRFFAASCLLCIAGVLLWLNGNGGF